MKTIIRLWVTPPFVYLRLCNIHKENKHLIPPGRGCMYTRIYNSVAPITFGFFFFNLLYKKYMMKIKYVVRV